MVTAILRLARLAALAGALLLVPAAVALAQDHGHGGDGGAGPDDTRSSTHFRLLANLPAVVNPASPTGATFTNSDLAFWGDLLVAGNYGGFRVIDIKDPKSPHVMADFRCNGAQGDVSIWGRLVFSSVDTAQSHPGCNSVNVTSSTAGHWEGVRVFDISNPESPVHLTSVYTDCGSHTHTLVPDLRNNRVLLYVSSYALTTASLGPNCLNDAQGGHRKISIIEVPLDAPQNAFVLREHPLHPSTQAINGPAIIPSAAAILHVTTGCHDITVFMELNLAGVACGGEGQLWDIRDPANPQVVWRVDNPDVDFWHSATFTWDGKVIAFGDEWAGASTIERGSGCRGTEGANANFRGGRIWFHDVATGTQLGSFTIPRPQNPQLICSAHNFNFIPGVRGYILVSAFYVGGTSVIDATNPAHAMEMEFFQAARANTWSSYSYNGHIYANDIVRGVDVFALRTPVTAGTRKLPFSNPQTQLSVTK